MDSCGELNPADVSGRLNPADVSDNADNPVSTLTDLPLDCLELLLERCTEDALRALACCRSLRTAAAATRSSIAWRRRAHNLEDLCLFRLRRDAYVAETLHGLSGGVRALCIKGDQLVSATKDNVARLWGLRSIGTCFAEWVHPQWVGACALSPGGGLLATGCDDSAVRIFHTELREQGTPPIELRGQSRSWITGVGFAAPDDTADDAAEAAVVSCSRDGELCVWDWRRWRQPGDDERCVLAREYARPVAQPGARSSSLVLALDVQRNRCVLPRSVSSATADASGQSLLVYEISAERALSRTESLDLDGRNATSVALDRGAHGAATQVAAGGGFGLVMLWDVRAGPRPVQRLENGCPGAIRAVALCGHLLVAGREPGPLVNVWDLRAPQIVQKLRGHANNDALALDGVKGRVACGGRMNELRVWQVEMG